MRVHRLRYTRSSRREMTILSYEFYMIFIAIKNRDDFDDDLRQMFLVDVVCL